MSKSDTADIRLFNMSNYVRPKVVESHNQDWVLNGRKNEFYQYIIDRYNGSVTNSAIINSYIDLIIGRGLVSLNHKERLNDWIKLRTILTSSDLRKIVSDFELFGEASFQITPKKNKELSSITHIPKQKVVPQKANEKGEIEGYWYSDDWARYTRPENKPEYFPAFGQGSGKQTEIYCIKPYRAGKDYFSDPDYLAALQYCLMEEEMSNYHVSHIQNGLSFGYIINIPNGNSYTPEEKDLLEKKIREKLTGSTNAGKFILSFNGVEAEITVVAIEGNSAHKQWEFLVKESKAQIMTGHRLTSASLVGLSTASGFSSTADEMDMAEVQLMKRVIMPKQNYITNALEDVLVAFGINLDLKFLPLTEEKSEIVKTEMNTHVCLSNESLADKLIELGEDESDDWEVIDDRRCDEITLTEQNLNMVFELASVPKTTDKKDVQDTSLFKIRYKYAGNPEGERDFCNKVLKANKVYRSEDLNANFNYNEDLAPKGKDSYNIFLYKGGVNCKHYWQRVVYLKKNNDKISVNSARKMILALEPSERKAAKWSENPKEVAQIAEKKNNYWSLKPNYRA